MINHWFDLLSSKDLNASKTGKFEKVYYHLGNHTLAVNYSENIDWAFRKTLRHIKKEPTEKADITINCFVVDNGFKFPFVKEDYQDQGLLERFNDEYHYALFHHGVEAYSFFDRTTSSGYYLVKNPGMIPFWELCAPFKYIIHWWSRDFDYQLIHGAFFDLNGNGLLLSGKGGSGKSTTTVGMVLNGQKTLGEDYILVDVKKRIAFSLYNTAKLDASGLARFPELKDHVDETLLLSSEEKTFFHIDTLRENSLIKKRNIDFHILPTINYSKNTMINAAMPSEGVKRLAPLPFFNYQDLETSPLENVLFFAETFLPMRSC